jgi:hypothetical protein
MKQRHLLLVLIPILGWLNCATAQLPSYVPSNSILAWWGFSGNGNDQSINNNHYTNYNMVFAADRFSTPNAAASGNGTTQYMLCNTPSFSFGANSTFTISLWMLKTSNTGGVMMMHGTTAAGNFIWNFQTNTTGGIMFGTNKQQSTWIWTQTTHGLNTWEHYVATYNNGAITLYKNGVVAATNLFTHTAVSQAVLPIYLGRGVSGSYSAGLLDDIGMWNRVLTQAEITDLFNGGCAPSFSSVVASNCHSYTWAQNNQTYTQSGSYKDTLMNYLGCDSIITLNLTIHPNTTATQYHLACDTFTWINGTTYTSTTDTATHIIPNAAGCDSIITLNLTVINLHFTQQPSNALTHTGSNAVFQATASPVGAIHRWQVFSGGSYQFLMDTGQYTGALTNTLTISNITVNNHQQQYRCVVYLGTCADTSDIAVITLSDIGMDEHHGASPFAIFPNPATDIVVIKANASMIGIPFFVADYHGRVVISGVIESETTEINLESLPAGVYIINAGHQIKQAFRVLKH